MFEFDLQALLNARMAIEEKRQMELAEAMLDLDVQKGIFTGIKHRRLQMIKEYYELGGRPVESMRLVIYSENIVLYRDMEMAQQEKCQEAEEKVGEKRLALIEASKQRKMIEKLKEKKLAEYRQELNRQESKELDEAAILRYGGSLS